MSAHPEFETARPAGRRALLALALACLAAWTGAVLRGGFAYDDREAVEGNPVALGALPWTAAFTRDYWHHKGDAGHYRPLATLALRADRALHGAPPGVRAWGWHATNVALHLAVVLLAARALLALPSGAALLRGLLPLAAHPVLADSVAWISGRTSMLACLGGTLALISAGAPGARRRSADLALGALAGAALLAGLLGKEDAVAFLPAALCVAALRGRGRVLAVGAGGAAAVAAALALRGVALGSALPSAPHAPLARLDLLERLPFGGRALLEAARLLVWPFGAPPSYRSAPGFTPDDPPSAWAALGWLAALAALAAGAAALARAARRPAAPPGARPTPSRGAVAACSAALAVLALVPTLQLVPAGEVFAPRFLYVPLLLAAPAFGVALARLPAPALAALALALAAGAWVRSGAYASRAAFAEAVLAAVPGDARSWNDLGVARREEGDLEGAVRAWTRATELDPGYGRPWSNLGGLALERGAVETAVRLLERAARLAPEQPVARANLANARLRAGDAAGAVREYERAVALAPGLQAAWRGLGNALLAAGEPDRARAALDEALRLDPKDGAARALRARAAPEPAR